MLLVSFTNHAVKTENARLVCRRPRAGLTYLLVVPGTEKYCSWLWKWVLWYNWGIYDCRLVQIGLSVTTLTDSQQKVNNCKEQTSFFAVLLESRSFLLVTSRMRFDAASFARRSVNLRRCILHHWTYCKKTRNFTSLTKQVHNTQLNSNK